MLTIRQMGQDILNSYALNDYHVSVDSARNLKIEDDEGNVLFAPKGVQFSKSNPTNKEIRFALELLEEFLVQHFIYIKAYMDKATEFRKKPKPKIRNKHFEIEAIASYYRSKYPEDIDYLLKYADDVFHWELGVTKDLKVTPSKVSIRDQTTSPTIMNQYIFDEQFVIKNGLPLAKDFIDWNEEKLAIEKQKEQLFNKKV